MRSSRGFVAAQNPAREPDRIVVLREDVMPSRAITALRRISRHHTTAKAKQAFGATDEA